MNIRFACIAMLALAGCKSDVDLKIVTSDLVAAEISGAPTVATAILGLGATSRTSCEEKADVLASAMASGFDRVEFVGCRAEGFDVFADFRVALPIVPPDGRTDRAMAVRMTANGDRLLVGLALTRATVDKIVQTLPREISMFAPDRIQPKIRVTVQNDLPDPVTIVSQGAFIDGEPFQLERPVELGRREEVLFMLSDVGSAALSNGGAFLFWLER